MILGYPYFGKPPFISIYLNQASQVWSRNTTKVNIWNPKLSFIMFHIYDITPEPSLPKKKASHILWGLRPDPIAAVNVFLDVYVYYNILQWCSISPVTLVKHVIKVN